MKWSFSLRILLLLMVIGIASCGGSSSGGGGGGGSGPTPFDILTKIFYRVVALDNATGSLAAGTTVPLVCTAGGSVIPSEGGCNSDHLHGTISITGIGSGFGDPANMNCGHGRVGDSNFLSLGYACPKVAQQQLALIMTSAVASFLVTYVHFYLPGNNTSTPDATVDVQSDLSQGEAIGIADASTGMYDKAVVQTACNKGTNPVTNEIEIEHKTITLSIDMAKSKYLTIACDKYADMVPGGVIVDLDAGVMSADFYTSGRSIGMFPLTAGMANVLNFDDKPYIISRTGFTVASTAMGFKSIKSKYDPFGGETIMASLANFTDMVDRTIDDSAFTGDAEYGLQVYMKDQGLFKSYFSLGNIPGVRMVPVHPNMTSGTHGIKGTFTNIEGGTGRTRSTSQTFYSRNPTGTISFLYGKANHFGLADFSITNSGTGNGASIDYSTYSTGLTGPSFVKGSFRAETLNTGTTPDTRHKFIDVNYASFGKNKLSYSDLYLTAAGATGFAPVDTDATSVRVQYSTDQEHFQNHSMFREWDLGDREGDTSIGVKYNF